MASCARDNGKLLQQQQEACDRMLSALHDVIRQEQEVRRRLETKKQKLAELQRLQEGGAVVHSSEVDRKQKELSLLNGEIEELQLAYKYQMDPVTHIQLPPQMVMFSDNLPPPLPPKTKIATTTRASSNRGMKEVGPEQWLCVYCNTVNSDLMPLCANCSK